MYSEQLVKEFMMMISSLREEVFILDEKIFLGIFSHQKRWRYSDGFDYDFNFYEDFTKNLKTNLNLGSEDIFYCDQLWTSFEEKYEFSVKEISPFFNSEYFCWYFADDYEGKLKKVNEILTKYRFARLKDELNSSSELNCSKKIKL